MSIESAPKKLLVDIAAAPDASPYQELLEKATAFYRAEDYDQARILSDELLRIAPNEYETLQLAGVITRFQQRLPESAEFLKQALGRAPDPESAAASWFSLGKTLRQAGDLRQAEEALRRAVQANPSVCDYVTELAQIYADGWKLDLAIETLKKAINRHPGIAAPCAALASILIAHGRHQDALIAFDLALARDPNDAYVHLSRGATLKVLGRLTEAESEVLKALQLNPMIEAYSHLAQLKKLNVGSPETQAMRERWDSGNAAPLKARIDAGFALARIHDKAGDYAAAFDYLQTANRLKRATVQFSIADHLEMSEGVMTLFTADFFARYEGKSESDLSPIFILGMPRSGTTLTEQILASHSQVQGGGELPGIVRVGKDLGKTWESRGTAAPGTDEMIAEDLKQAAAHYADMTSHLWRKRPRFTDKMPMNSLYISIIHLLFPKAKIVYCRRNPIATCLSCYQILFGPGNMVYSYDLTELGQYYKIHARVMEHWKKVLPGRILEVEYEQLVEHTESETRRILEFCDLEFEPACLNFYNLERPVATASQLQVRRPIYRESLDHWKNYQPFLGPLFEALEITPACDSPA
jgi:tetratricopeptide (TPR) repeat protein